MKILLTADPFLPIPPGGYGGIERIVDALARGLAAAGHEVHLAAHPGSTCTGARLHPWPAGGLGAHCAHLWRLHRRLRPDVIHSFSRLAVLAPLFATRQRMLMSYQRHTGGRGVRAAAVLGGRRLRFTGCSEFICTMGRRAGGHWTAIPNFVEPDTYPFCATVDPDAPLVFLSRIDRIKGPDLAIRIARRAGRRLILAGNIPTDPEGRRFWESVIAPEIGHGGVEFAGEVDDARKAALLGAAAALLLPIQWDEPFGIVYAEALACGTPILTCPRGAAPEIVRTGETGWLFHTEDEGVAAAGRIPELNRAACRADAENRFFSNAAVRAYLAAYRDLLDA